MVSHAVVHGLFGGHKSEDIRTFFKAISIYRKFLSRSCMNCLVIVCGKKSIVWKKSKQFEFHKYCISSNCKGSQGLPKVTAGYRACRLPPAKRDRLDNKNLFSEQLRVYKFWFKKNCNNSILLTPKSNLLEIFFLSILITNYKSNPFNLGEFEYSKNVELSSKRCVTS